jgi:hypothetical protein
MSECKGGVGIWKIFMVKSSDLKTIDNSGIVFKRKYGKFKRQVVRIK